MSVVEAMSDLEHQLSLLRSELGSKPSGYAVAGLMAGIIALPFLGLTIYTSSLESRLGALQLGVEAAVDLSDRSATASSLAAEASSATLARVDNLILAIARSSAQSEVEWGNLIAWESKLKEIFPADIYAKLVSNQMLSNFKYSDFDGRDWIFVTRANFNALNSDIQAAIVESLKRGSVEFHIDE